MKYCKDCRWIEKNPIVPLHLRKCNFPQPEDFDFTGDRVETPFAQLSRKWGPCGSDGIYFEPRVPFWKRILSWLVK